MDGNEQFRARIRAWLHENLAGEFAELRGLGGPGREHEAVEGRLAWERHLGAAGWIGLGWPQRVGGQGATVEQQVIFHEEYARAAAPGRVGHVGEQLLGPTIIAFGSPQQQAEFLPGILSGETLWCQGYSEPDAGSDLAAVRTRAALRDGQWHVTGQKIWTSLARWSQWCFVVCRTDPDSSRHAGLSFLLVPLDQPGVEIRPIAQLTGTSEFNEVFFEDAVADAAHIVGAPGDGWKVAMGTLSFERGVATLGQQVGFERELTNLDALARSTGAADDPAIDDRLVDAWAGLQVLRATAMRTLGGDGGVPDGIAASISKLLWGNWHQRLGELAVDVLGPTATLTLDDRYGLTEEQQLYLFSRADTIYGGSNEIQRNIIAERHWGLPRDRGPA